MEPIIKILEEDEDESMHSRVDLDAFTAEFNRDIGRTDICVPPVPDSAAGPSKGSTSTSIQLVDQWKTSNQDVNPIQKNIVQTEERHLQLQEQYASQVGQVKEQSVFENLHQESSSKLGQEQPCLDQQQLQQSEQGLQIEMKNDKTIETNEVHHAEQHPAAAQEENITQKPEKQHPIKQLSNQQIQSSDHANNPMKRMKFSSISFYHLIPVLRPHLDKDRFMQLNDVFSKLKSNEISRDDFLRVIRNTVGDQMLRQAVHKVMQAQVHAVRNPPVIQNHQQAQLQTQISMQQLPARGPHIPEQQSFCQLRPASQIGQRMHPGQSDYPTSTIKFQNDSSSLVAENNLRTPKVMESLSDSQGMHATQNSSVSMKQESSMEIMKQQNQLQMPPTSFAMHGSTNNNYVTHQFPRPSNSGSQGVLSSQSGPTHTVGLVNASTSLSNFATHQVLQEDNRTWPPSSIKEQRGSSSSSMVHVKQEAVEQAAENNANDEHNEKQLARVAFHTSTRMTSTGPSAFSSEQALQVSAISPGLVGPINKTSIKKPSIGQKKPLESQGTPSLASKKQKVAGAFQDQSIEQLNDVTAVSGVNLREEEEQLLTASREESKASEATRRTLQEEEERLIVQRHPLQKKIAEIMSKCGVENVSRDVERCLSLCVEERLRGLISNLIRLSKQRVDSEKARHQIVFTSDVRREVLAINQKAKEDLDKKHAEEAEKTRKITENEGNTGVDGEKEKEEGRSKVPKAHKDEDDKMRTTAANVAARAAVGGDDMLSKWQLMAELARQKREGGGLDGISTSQPGKAAGFKQNSGKAPIGNQGDKKDDGASSSGALHKFGRTTMMANNKVARNICVKDVIAVLQREPQMSKSSVLFRLFERINTTSA